MKTVPYDWQRFHAYRVFDEFLERFVLQRKSYVTTHTQPLDFAAAFDDIRERFVIGADESNAHFEEKILHQFEGASEDTKIVFANVEYLWAMPMENISPKKKRSYALRWFPDPGLVVSGESFFFVDPHTIANPGPWYLRNKDGELEAALRVLYLVTSDSGLKDLATLKQKIAGICHAAIYDGIPAGEKFSFRNRCGIHSALMHMAEPDRFEPIISDSHRRQICAVLGSVVGNPSPDLEVRLKQIRNSLFESHGNGNDPDFKYRWFFHTKDVLPLWIGKKGVKLQQVNPIVFDVRNEEDAVDLEGGKEEVTGCRIQRSAKLVAAAKKRDRYTCCACGFHFEDEIVHVHHLDPLSEYKRPKETKLDDLITLCPTCHYLAHYWLRKSDCYKRVDELLEALKRA